MSRDCRPARSAARWRAAIAALAIALASPLAAQSGASGPATAAALGPGFEDRYETVNGVRLHYVVGGQGPALLLVPGWPETWWSWRHLMPTLAKTHTVIAVETRGMGQSSRPAAGYDVRTVSQDLFDLMSRLGHDRFGLVGHDIGVWLGYAMAADRPRAIERLALLDSNLPGVTRSPPVFQDREKTTRSWHFMFNQLEGLPEALVQGREREFLSWLYANYAYRPSAVAADEYIRAYSSPGAMSAGFAYYRALPETIAQNAERVKVRLAMPILALGGEFGTADMAETTLKPQADNLRGGVLKACGHYVAEECPQAVLDKLVPFLTAR